MGELRDNIGCINPHGMHPFPVSREVCPDCIEIRERAIRQRLASPAFTPRHGLRYRWWRDIPWGVIVTSVMTLLIAFAAALILGAWVFDWKAWW